VRRLVAAAKGRLGGWLRSGRALAGGTAALVAVPALLVIARGDGFPVSRTELSSGSAWLASTAQGAVTLIDGPSEEVVGLVRAPGARVGDDLSVLQSGSSAYLVNSSQGTVSRVDGGTYETSTPVLFGTPGGELSVFAGGGKVYVVDGSRRTASLADPVSLRVRERLSMAGQPGPGQAIVDGAGRLWAVDRNGGGLTWFDGVKRVRREVGAADARLVLVGGRPVLVEPTLHRLGRLDDDGRVSSWSCLDVRGGDQVRLLGSATSDRVFAVVPATGTLVAGEVGHDDCNVSVDVGKPGDDFGTLAESDRFLFVPDRTTGRTIVVDTAAGEVVADLSLVGPNRQLELLAKDGLVFYNDLGGDRAGVIRFDGRRWQPGKSLTKYRAGKNGVQVLAPGGQQAKPPQTKTTPPRTPPGTPPGGNPQQPPNPPANPPGQPPPSDGPPAPLPPGSGPGSPPANPGDPGDPGNPGQPPASPPAVRVIASTTHPVVDEVVTFQAAGRGGPNPTGAQWTFGDGQQGTGVTTRHSWTNTATYPVSVTATFPDGSTASGTVSVQVGRPPTGTLTVQLTGAGDGTVTSKPAGVSCPPTCTAQFPQATIVTLTAAPSAAATFDGWSNGCTGSATDCNVTVSGSATVGAGFGRRPTLTVTAPANGKVTGDGINCPPTCSATFDPGQSVRLAAQPDPYYDFAGWGGACGGTGACALTMDSAKTVSAGFRDTAAAEDCIGYDPTNLSIEDLGATGFRLNSGNIAMQLFDNRADADNGLSMARGFNQQCFVGRGTSQITEYWQGGSGQPGPVSGPDCINYDETNLSIVGGGSLWQVTDGNSILDAFTSEDRAVRGLRVAQQHGSQCFIGRDNTRPDRDRYITEYFV
jgi:hypothetical protein